MLIENLTGNARQAYLDGKRDGALSYSVSNIWSMSVHMDWYVKGFSDAHQSNR